MRWYLFGALFCALFLVAIVPSVSAATFGDCSNLNDVLFKISSVSNAHAEIYSQNNYGQRLCYGDFFKGTAPNNAHTGTGKVLKLSSVTNAHVADPNGASTFATVGTYSDMKCDLRVDASDCYNLVNNGHRGSVIASLSSSGNAHIGLGNFYDATKISTGMYLCCASSIGDPKCVPDGKCTADEIWQNCPDDCPNHCTNKHWDQDKGETAEDCGGVCPACTVPQAVCGNNLIEGTEECDGTKLNGKTCENLNKGFTGGTLSCYGSTSSKKCTFDTSDCKGTVTPPGVCQDLYKLSGGTTSKINYCGDYTTAQVITGTGSKTIIEQCNLDCNRVYQNDLKKLLENGIVVSGTPPAECVWEDSKCVLSYSTPIPGGGGSSASCKIVYSAPTSDTCTEGQTEKEITYSSILLGTTANAINDGCYCNGIAGQLDVCTKKIKCPQAVVLPFFGPLGITLSVLAIALIYGIVGVYNHKKSKKRHSITGKRRGL